MNRHSRSAAFASLAVLFVLVGGIFVHNARTLDEQREAALVANVAGRLRSDVERYVSDVALLANGVPADPEASLTLIRETATALAEGGEVPAIQGGGEIELSPPPQSSKLGRKLDQQRELTDELADRGDALLELDPDSPAGQAALKDLRVTGASWRA